MMAGPTRMPWVPPNTLILPPPDKTSLNSRLQPFTQNISFSPLIYSIKLIFQKFLRQNNPMHVHNPFIQKKIQESLPVFMQSQKG